MNKRETRNRKEKEENSKCGVGLILSRSAHLDFSCTADRPARLRAVCRCPAGPSCQPKPRASRHCPMGAAQSAAFRPISLLRGSPRSNTCLSLPCGPVLLGRFLLRGSRQRWHVRAARITAKTGQAVPTEPEYKNRSTMAFLRIPSKRRHHRSPGCFVAHARIAGEKEAKPRRRVLILRLVSLVGRGVD
jgi:hypothetical protein